MEALGIPPEVIGLISEIRAVGLWSWAGAAALLMGLIRIWQLAPVQALALRVSEAQPKLAFLVWNNLKPWVKWAIPFVGAFIAAIFASLGSGLSWGASLTAAVGVAIASIGKHHGTKALGKATSGKVHGLPSALRGAASLVLPIDTSRVPGHPDYKPPDNDAAE